MKAIFVSAAGLVLAVAGFPALAQPPTQAQIAAAQALFGQMDPACTTGVSGSRSCGVLVYSPVDCSGKKDGHIRQVYSTYADRTVRFQQNNTSVARQRPMALLQPFAIIARDGKSTQFSDPQFISLADYDRGTHDVKVCGQSFHIKSDEFTLPDTLKKFLKENP